MSVTVRGTDVLFNDGTTTGTAPSPANVQVFTSSGTFTVPAGVTKLRVLVFGAGGGGSGSYYVADNYGYAGRQPWGGAGGAVEAIITSGISPGQTISVTVGTGGNGGSAATGNNVNNGGTGGTGGTSSFGAFITCTGGTGGNSQANSYGVNGTVTLSGASRLSQANAYPGVHGLTTSSSQSYSGGAGGPGMSSGGCGGWNSSTLAGQPAIGPGNTGGSNSGRTGGAGGSPGGSGGAASGYTGTGGGGGGGGGGVIVFW